MNSTFKQLFLPHHRIDSIHNLGPFDFNHSMQEKDRGTMHRFDLGRKTLPSFTLIELLIVIGVIVVLIALLLPSVASVRARARTAECQSNLAQLGVAMNAASRSTPVRAEVEVLDTNGDPMLDADGNSIKISWADQIEPFLEGENEDLFNCPADFQAGNLPPVLVPAEVAV